MAGVIIDYSIPVDDFKRAIQEEERKIKVANRRASEALGKKGIQLFKGVTRNFKHQVEFTTVTNETGDKIEVLIGSDDKILGYLDRGTSVRYAIMSADFVAQTRPGSLQSSAGHGGVVIINRNNPRPGIPARNFTGQIEAILNREAEPTFNRELSRIR